MSRRAITIKSERDPGYQEFQRLANAVRDSNRRKRRMHDAIAKLQRKYKKTQKKRKKAITKIQALHRGRKTRQTNKNRSSAVTKITAATRRFSAINQRISLKLNKTVRELMKDFRKTAVAKKIFSKMDEYDQNKFESCLRNCLRTHIKTTREVKLPNSRFSKLTDFPFWLRQLSNENSPLDSTSSSSSSYSSSPEEEDGGGGGESKKRSGPIRKRPFKKVPKIKQLMSPYSSYDSTNELLDFSPKNQSSSNAVQNLQHIAWESPQIISASSIPATPRSKRNQSSRFIRVSSADAAPVIVNPSDYSSDVSSVDSNNSLDELYDFKSSKSENKKGEKEAEGKKKTKKRKKKTRKGGKRKKNPKRGSYNKLTRKQQQKRISKFLKKRMKILNNGPPRGIISDSWVSKTCPCRDGDDCIPCPYHLKNFKDGRKKTKKNKKFLGLF